MRAGPGNPFRRCADDPQPVQGSTDATPSTGVAVFAPLFPPAFRGGGPIRSIQALVATADDDMHPFVMTGDRDLGARQALPVPKNTWCQRNGVDVYYATLHSLGSYWQALRAVRRRRPDLLHLNSFMNPRLSIVPLLLWRLGYWGKSVLLLAPRGEFGEGALGRRPLKKRLYMEMVRMLRIHRSVIWHSTAAHETLAIRRWWGVNAVVVERGNDTMLPTQASPPPEPEAGAIRAVFLGRIVEHKGLAIALEALAAVTHPVDFDVYGSREDKEYVALCERLAAAVAPCVRVTFHDAVAPHDVVTILAAHDVLLMPTAGENFGHVIAEALSASSFVATTPHTPWTDRLRDGGGVVVADRSPQTWATVIDELAQEAPSIRSGRRLAAGRAYNEWSSRPREPHVWALALRAAGGGE